MLRNLAVILLALMLFACTSEEDKKKQAQAEGLDKVFGNLPGTRIKKTENADANNSNTEAEGMDKVFGNLPGNKIKKD